MKIEIRATYPATDGSMPEDVSVEIDAAPVTSTSMGDAPGVASSEVVALILPILGQMLAAPAQRLKAGLAVGWVADAVKRTAPAAVQPEWSGDLCRRSLCGHPASAHNLYDDDDEMDPDGKPGRCDVCANSAKCSSFVGPTDERASLKPCMAGEYIPKGARVGVKSVPGAYDQLFGLARRDDLSDAGTAMEQFAEGAWVEDQRPVGAAPTAGAWHLSARGKS